MVYFQTKNPNLGKFWRSFDWKLLTNFMAICNILWTFGTFCVHFILCWYHAPRKIWQPWTTGALLPTLNKRKLLTIYYI
jgi:hypothetical protein